MSMERLAGQHEIQSSFVIRCAQQGRMGRRQIQQLPRSIQVLRSSFAERIVFDAGVKPI